MKNLLKSTLVVVVATAAAGMLATAAIAATPELSPVPTKCSNCGVSKVSFGFGKGPSGTWSGWPASWTFAGLSGGSGSFESWDEGTEVEASFLTFENNLCRNEGLNFKTEALKGSLHVIEDESGPTGVVGVALEPRAGSLFGQCSYTGSPSELTGSYIADIGPTNTPTNEFHVYLSGEGHKKFAPLEQPRQISMSVNKGAPGTPLWTGSVPLNTSETVELHTAGRTATFATPKYEGGFGLIGGAMKFVSKNGLSVNCKYTSGSGAFTSATGGEVTLHFTGCKGVLNQPCNDVTTAALKAQLAYTYPATETAEGRQTGVVLSPKEAGGAFNEFVCGTQKSVDRGALIAVISPLGKSSSTFAVALKQKQGVEEHIMYEGPEGATEAKLENSIEGSKWEQSGVEVTSPSIKLNDGGEETIR